MVISPDGFFAIISSFEGFKFPSSSRLRMGFLGKWKRTKWLLNSLPFMIGVENSMKYWEKNTIYLVFENYGEKKRSFFQFFMFGNIFPPNRSIDSINCQQKKHTGLFFWTSLRKSFIGKLFCWVWWGMVKIVKLLND